MNRTARVASRRGVSREGALRVAWMTDSHAWSICDNDPEHPNAVEGSRYFWTVGDKIEQFVEQVNADQPHAVMHTGDLIERGRDFDFFLSKWDGLDSALTQAVVPGNHDFAFTKPAGSTLGETVAGDMGYGAKPLIAGSRFNQSVVFSGNGVTARFLMLDTNILPGGLHAPSNTGYLSEELLTWIEGELAASPEDLIFLCSHHGPHMWGSVHHNYFDTDDAQGLKDIVDAEVAARPARKITSLFGHHHLQSAVMRWDNLGPNLPGFLAPATVELNPSSYINLLVTQDGKVGWEMKSTQYPNP